LEVKLRRRYEVEANVGDERRVAVKSGGRQEYPDLVLTVPGATGRKSRAIVEVETAESVNRLEAMHEWVRFSKVPAAFHLYGPAASVDVARRLCKEHRLNPAEVWSFVPLGEQYRFTQVVPTPGLVEPEMDLEEVRAERRAAVADYLAAETPSDASAAAEPAAQNAAAGEPDSQAAAERVESRASRSETAG